MDYLIYLGIGLVSLVILGFSKAARNIVEMISSYFSHDIYRFSTSTPKRMAFELSMIGFCALLSYGQFTFYDYSFCGVEESTSGCEDCMGTDCSFAVTTILMLVSLVVSFSITKIIVKTVMIGQKLMSGHQRSESMEHYWRNVYPTEKKEREMAASLGGDAQKDHSHGGHGHSHGHGHGHSHAH